MSMKKIFPFIIMLFLTSPAFAQERNLKLFKPPTENLTDQKRKAVVIGMSDYGESRSLNNTLNDASDMAEVFTKLGFEVTLLKNNDLRNLKANLANWYGSIEGNDMAVFYFAGHGMEVNGENYLVPVGAELNSQTDVEYNTLNVNQVLGNMNERRVSMKLLVLDACRDNPFKRSWSRGSEEKGLAQMSAPKGTYIAFAASPGFTAQDGGNYQLTNGVFTYYLKQEILKPGVSIDEIFNNVTGDVSNLTHDQQTPFKNSSLTKTFYFILPSSNEKLMPTPAVVVNKPESFSAPVIDKPVVNNKRNGESYSPDGIELVYVEGNGAIKGFYIGKYEITQAQWMDIMGSNPSKFKGDNLPVERVNWNDAQEFLNQLNVKTGRNYRLPTNAEWQFAAQGGGLSKGYTYSGSNNINDVAWYEKNSGGRTHPIGTKTPNELGIYDMSGNVWEWCQDWNDNSKQFRVDRGGSWDYFAVGCTVLYRYSDNSVSRFNDLGFRVVLP